MHISSQAPWPGELKELFCVYRVSKLKYEKYVYEKYVYQFQCDVFWPRYEKTNVAVATLFFEMDTDFQIW